MHLNIYAHATQITLFYEIFHYTLADLPRPRVTLIDNDFDIFVWKWKSRKKVGFFTTQNVNIKIDFFFYDHFLTTFDNFIRKSQHLFRYDTDFNKAYTTYILYTASSIQSSFQSSIQILN